MAMKKFKLTCSLNCLVTGLFLCVILFAGTPDLMDAIICWVSDGRLPEMAE